MALIHPTLHVEVQLKSPVTPATKQAIRAEVTDWLHRYYKTVELGSRLECEARLKHSNIIGQIQVADFTGPTSATGLYAVEGVLLDVQTYMLKGQNDTGERRSIKQDDGDSARHARSLALPNVSLSEDWDSLVFADALPARLLRYLVRMIALMSQPDLNLSTFNWNRLCLLSGPPGSGKSTLCRALAQKLAIRLGEKFAHAELVEINANALLSKYFGESGKAVERVFGGVEERARRGGLVVVIVDEVETIAGSRRVASGSGECGDGVRATNQLLTALDRLRYLPNVITCCTSNMIEAIDPAFLDRVDIKQHIPSPSPSTIYNIFHSCLTELLRTTLLTPSTSSLPTLAEIQITLHDNPDPAGKRLWVLAEKCAVLNLSGRVLRRLPILGLARWTWGGQVGVEDAVAALERAVEEESGSQLSEVEARGGDEMRVEG